MAHLTLYQFPAVPGLPSMSPFCIKVYMALCYKSVDFDVVSTVFARRHNPSGKLPALSWNGELIFDSTAIVKAIDQRAKGPALMPDDPHLAAEAHILEDWADESLYWFGVYAKFADPDGWALYRKPLAAAMPLAVRAVAPTVARRGAVKRLQGQGLLSRSGELIRAEFKHHVKALAARVDSGAYLVGESLSLADLAVAAMLLPLITGATPEFQGYIEAEPALVTYLERVRAESGMDAARPSR